MMRICRLASVGLLADSSALGFVAACSSDDVGAEPSIVVTDAAAAVTGADATLPSGSSSFNADASLSTPGDATTSDAGMIFNATPPSDADAQAGVGGPIVTDETTSIHFERKGGLPHNNGAAPFSCYAPTSSVTLDLTAHALNYTLCSSTSAANLVGTVQLSDGDFQAAVAEARTMVAAYVEICVEDSAYATVAASSEAGAGMAYLDFTCVDGGPITTATNVDATLDQLLGLIPAACPWLSDCH